MANSITLPANSNQALGIARYAIDFLSDGPKKGEPSDAVLARTERFHTDAAICGLSALALGTNAPTVLRREAMRYRVTGEQRGATCLACDVPVHPEKAILANSAAVREWDSNGTNFGYNKALGHTAGEFGHNDFYPVCVAAAQVTGADGAKALRAMVCLDEIRGRLAEVFSLKDCKIDHVLHGAIGSAAVYGAMLGATEEQIESAIGMVVAHFVPFRAIRAGKQLSDSKGSSAAITTEAAIACVHRSMDGFVGPKDIFRNPEAVFRLFEGPGQLFARTDRKAPANTKPADASPFDLVLGVRGDDFAVMGMHFKIGLYEHQSAGALQAVITLLERNPMVLDETHGGIKSVRIVAYEPAFGIIGDPAKRDPRTRQSADHSMVYIVATLLRKALEKQTASWEALMLGPRDYDANAVFNAKTRELMDKIHFEHGGPEYDAKYPDGIPTSVVIETADGTELDSRLVMYPAGHARNTEHDLDALLQAKWKMLGELASDEPAALVERFSNVGAKSAQELAAMNTVTLAEREPLAEAHAASKPEPVGATA